MRNRMRHGWCLRINHLIDCIRILGESQRMSRNWDLDMQMDERGEDCDGGQGIEGDKKIRRFQAARGKEAVS